MRAHIAIVVPMYEALILGGEKTIECRLTMQPREPFGAIVPGERVYFKRSGGPFFAVATVDRVWMTDNLTPGKIEEIRRQFDKQIHGEAAFWKSRRHCRYATLVWLRDVEATADHPPYRPQNMRAWYCVDEGTEARRHEGTEGRQKGAEGRHQGSEASRQRGKPKLETRNPKLETRHSKPETRHSPLATRHSFLITLTAGAIKNRYVRVAEHRAMLPADCFGGKTKAMAGRPITLSLTGGDVVETDVLDTPANRAMLRWRKWGAWFKKHELRAGDKLRFTADGPRRFVVSIVRAAEKAAAE